MNPTPRSGAGEARRTARAHGTNAAHGVAVAMATCDYELALSILSDDADVAGISEGLSKVAEALAKAKSEHAEEFALAIPDPKIRCQALLRVRDCFSTRT